MPLFSLLRRALALSALATTVFGAVTAEGLAGHWSFDSLADNRVADQSASGNPLLLAHARFRAVPLIDPLHAADLTDDVLQPLRMLEDGITHDRQCDGNHPTFN